VTAVLFAPDNRTLATAGGDGLVKLWDVATASEIKTLTGHKRGVLALAWGAEGKTLVSGGVDGMLRLWDTDPSAPTFGKELDAVRAHPKEVACLSSAKTGKTLASGSSDGSVKVWGLEGAKFAKESVEVKTEGGAVYCLALRDDGGLLATGHEDGKVRLWNPLNGLAADLKMPVLADHTARVTALAFVVSNADYLLTVSGDRTIKLWEIATSTALVTRRCHADTVTGLAVGKDMRNVVTCSADHTIKVWDTRLMEFPDERITLSGHNVPVRAVALSWDRRIIASAGQDGTVLLWRTAAHEGNILQPIRP
jgi:WD40 repeat protein